VVPKAKGKQEAMAFAPPQPAWLSRPAPPAPAALRRISPSTAGAGLARVTLAPPRGDALLAAERGRLIHRMLQSLPEMPEAERRARAKTYVDSMAATWPEDERAALVDGVLAVLAHPDFAPVFAPGSRAEVEIAGRFGDAMLSGRIDRLAVTDARVLVVDYKTNRPAPESLGDAPHEYVIQLALYRAMLRRLYPGRTVAAAILWTDRPALMEIPSVLLDLAEMEAAVPSP
jgi:ATP-dependent helicase/nuclease subunit A